MHAMAGASSFAHSLSIWLGMLSGPVAFSVLMFSKSFWTPSGLMMMSLEENLVHFLVFIDD